MVSAIDELAIIMKVKKRAYGKEREIYLIVWKG